MSTYLQSDDAPRDLAWRGYDARAMMPVAAAAGVVSVLMLLGRWLLEDLAAFAEHVGSLVLFTPVFLMWFVVFAFWLYRCVTYTYRITTRDVLVDRGFRWPPEPAVPLADVTDVRATFGPVGAWLGVGSVTVTAAGGRRLEMRGVSNPAAFAEEIRRASNEARKGWK